MLSDAEAFWNAIKPRVDEEIKRLTANAVRRERYDVVTAPNGTTIGVKVPFGRQEISIPYSSRVASAEVGDTVLVEWRGTLSNAIAVSFGDGK